jgi:hypothetical protein
LCALVRDVAGRCCRTQTWSEKWSGNRDFLQAHFQAGENAGEALEKHRRKIVEQFFPQRGLGKLKLAEARKAIRDCRKATHNLTGIIDLLLAYVENGTEFTQQFGDINKSCHNSLESALNEMGQQLAGEGREFYPTFRERLQRLVTRGDGIGWGVWRRLARTGVLS